MDRESVVTSPCAAAAAAGPRVTGSPGADRSARGVRRRRPLRRRDRPAGGRRTTPPGRARERPAGRAAVGRAPVRRGPGPDAAGFLASIAALRTLPLFVVQSAIASSVAVTAVLAVVFLGARLERREIVALVVVGLGLLALALSATPERAVRLGPGAQWVMLAGVVPVAAVALAGLVRRGPPSAVLLAVASGLGVRRRRCRRTGPGRARPVGGRCSSHRRPGRSWPTPRWHWSATAWRWTGGR